MRIIIIVHRLSPLQRQQIRTALSQVQGVGWWNHFESAFLVVDQQNRGLPWWRDYIADAVPGLSYIVLSGAGGWAAYASDEATQWLANW